MKAIPKQELLTLINLVYKKIIFEGDIANLFNNYGDDYYKDYGSSPFELCNKNQQRAELLKKISERQNI